MSTIDSDALASDLLASVASETTQQRLSERFAECRNSMTSRGSSEPRETFVPVNRAARRAAQRASKR